MTPAARYAAAVRATPRPEFSWDEFCARVSVDPTGDGRPSLTMGDDAPGSTYLHPDGLPAFLVWIHATFEADDA